MVGGFYWRWLEHGWRKELSDFIDRLHKIHLLNGRPLDGYTWSYQGFRDVHHKQLMQYLLKPWAKWKMHNLCSKFQSQNVQVIGDVYQSTTGQNHGPVWKIQSFFSTGFFYRHSCGRIVVWKAIRESSFFGTRLEKFFLTGNASLSTQHQDFSYQCLWTTPNRQARQRT